MAFILSRRPSPWNALFRCVSNADVVAADVFDAGRAFRILSGSWLWHRLIGRLALGLHGARAAQWPLPARCQARRSHCLCVRCGYFSLAGGTMAEFNP